MQAYNDFLNTNNVSYYIYETPIDLNWYQKCKNNPENKFHQHRNYKHSDDLYFSEKLLGNHPWRVFEKSEATVFVLPILLSYFLHYQNCEIRSYNVTSLKISKVKKGSQNYTDRRGAFQPRHFKNWFLTNFC